MSSKILSKQDKFEIKLNQLIEKYAKISNNNENNSDIDNSKNLNSYNENKDSCDENGDSSDENKLNSILHNKRKKEYLFHYKIEVTNKEGDTLYSLKTLFEINFKIHEDPDNENNIIDTPNFDLEKNKKRYDIVFYDDELGKYIQDLVNSPGLFEDLKNVPCDALLSSINDIRIKNLTEEKFSNNKINNFLNFIEELYNDKIHTFDKMIENGKIDFDSLWYLFDKINSIYRIKFYDYHLCFKYNSFYYGQYKMKDTFNLNGYIYMQYKNKFHECEFTHRIESFNGSKKIENLKIQIVYDSFSKCYSSDEIFKSVKKIYVNDDEKENILNYSDKIMNLYNSINHMNIDGSILFQTEQGMSSIERTERVIVDPAGLDKYSNNPLPITVDSPIDVKIFSPDDDENNHTNPVINYNNKYIQNKLLILPFIGVFNLGVKKRWGVTHVKNLSNIEYQDNAFDYLVLNENKKRIIKCMIKNSKDNQYHDFIKKKVMV